VVAQLDKCCKMWYNLVEVKHEQANP
jgi:hypothetical protein